MKYKIPDFQLMEQLNDQKKFLELSSNNYDSGVYSEAKRIATHLRVLLHHKGSSKSLMKQLGFQDEMIFCSTAGFYHPINMCTTWSLLSVLYNGSNISFQPLLNQTKSVCFFKFEDWWNEIILDDKRECYTRRDIVLFVANKDGGAHVDPVIDKKFWNLLQENSLAIFVEDKDGIRKPQNNPIYASIRQIAYEFLYSISFLFTDKKTFFITDSQFVMKSDGSKKFLYRRNNLLDKLKEYEKYKDEKRSLYIIMLDNIQSYLIS